MTGGSAGRTAVILAGGLSRRMGGDKALVRLGGVRLIDHVLVRLVPQAARLLISGPRDYGTGLEFIPDLAEAPHGPAAGVYSIWQRLASLDPGAGFVTVPVDGPLLPSDLVERLAAGEGAAIASDGRNDHPTFACWTCQILSAAWPLLRRKPPSSLKCLAAACAARRVVWPCADNFLNINTPGDLERAEGLLRRSRST